MLFEIYVGLVADGEIEMDVLLYVCDKGGLDDGLDWRKAGPAGDGKNRPGVVMAQPSFAVRSLDPHPIADPKLACDIPACPVVSDLTDMEFEVRLISTVGHRVIARWQRLERNTGILPSRKLERPSVCDFEAYHSNVVGGILKPDDSAGEAVHGVICHQLSRRTLNLPAGINDTRAMSPTLKFGLPQAHCSFQTVQAGGFRLAGTVTLR